MSDEKVEKHLYRKIEVRMWGDEKFRALSAMLPSAQGLWFYLLTGPHTSAIPGVFRAGRAAMAEELEWSTEGFDEAFAELFQQGMAKADWKAKVVWVPKVINCNPPASPNVVKSWGRAWGLLPECDLKREAYESLSVFVCGMGKPFAEAFEKAIAKPSAKTIGNQEAVNSKQEAVDKPSLPTLSSGEKDAVASKEAAAPQAAGESERSDDAQGSLLPDEQADAQQTAPATKRHKSKSGDEDPIFCEAMDAYPARDGGNPRPAAWEAWRARQREGVDPAVMLAGVKRYAVWCVTNGKVGTQFVPMAASFFGTKKPGFNEPWTIGAPTLTPMHAQRKEKFDPFDYTSQTNANTETRHEEHGDYIDVQFNEVDR
jgi:hypothetical protein